MSTDILFALCIHLLKVKRTNHMSLTLKAALLTVKKKKSLKRLLEVYARKVQNRQGIQHAVHNDEVELIKFYKERNDEKFKDNFRLHISTFQQLVTFLFEEEKSHGWSIEIELMVFLYWIASGCCYRIVGISFRMPKSSVVRIIHKFLKIFTNNLRKFVKLPKTEDLDSIGEGFCALAKNNCFKKAVGAIDGCHVRIAKVPEEQAASYFSYKGSFSSNFQAVVDNKGVFIDVFIGFPGSVHDCRVFRNSPLYVHTTYPPRGYYLLGDGGYPLLSEPIGMIIPFKIPQLNAVPGERVLKSRFNALHSRARSVVERAFGRLKARWRSIFFKQLEVTYTRVPQVIASCIALQNFFIKCNDIIEPPDEELAVIDVGEDADGAIRANDVSGNELRLRIARTASTLALMANFENDHDYI